MPFALFASVPLPLASAPLEILSKLAMFEILSSPAPFGILPSPAELLALFSAFEILSPSAVFLAWMPLSFALAPFGAPCVSDVAGASDRA